jgi:hypothetical protein
MISRLTAFRVISNSARWSIARTSSTSRERIDTPDHTPESAGAIRAQEALDHVVGDFRLQPLRTLVDDVESASRLPPIGDVLNRSVDSSLRWR